MLPGKQRFTASFWSLKTRPWQRSIPARRMPQPDRQAIQGANTVGKGLGGPCSPAFITRLPKASIPPHLQDSDGICSSQDCQPLNTITGSLTPARTSGAKLQMGFGGWEGEGGEGRQGIILKHSLNFPSEVHRPS